MISIESAKEYFDCHLLGEFFLESGEQLMLSAVKMAANDVNSQLSAPPCEDSADYIAAVCEQAVFLLVHKDELTQKQTLLSETIEGLGSRTYAAPQNDIPPMLSPRAELFIENINFKNSSGTVRFGRG